jgi:hypothetical protein
LWTTGQSGAPLGALFRPFDGLVGHLLARLGRNAELADIGPGEQLLEGTLHLRPTDSLLHVEPASRVGRRAQRSSRRDQLRRTMPHRERPTTEHQVTPPPLVNPLRRGLVPAIASGRTGAHRRRYQRLLCFRRKHRARNAPRRCSPGQGVPAPAVIARHRPHLRPPSPGRRRKRGPERRAQNRLIAYADVGRDARVAWAS